MIGSYELRRMTLPEIQARLKNLRDKGASEWSLDDVEDFEALKQAESRLTAAHQRYLMDGYRG